MKQTKSETQRRIIISILETRSVDNMLFLGILFLTMYNSVEIRAGEEVMAATVPPGDIGIQDFRLLDKLHDST